jgi:hypothetical protein
VIAGLSRISEIVARSAEEGRKTPPSPRNDLSFSWHDGARGRISGAGVFIGAHESFGGEVATALRELGNSPARLSL